MFVYCLNVSSNLFFYTVFPVFERITQKMSTQARKQSSCSVFRLNRARELYVSISAFDGQVLLAVQNEVIGLEMYWKIENI
jgi:hypothetical protein